jgi:hypothetical protein
MISNSIAAPMMIEMLIWDASRLYVPLLYRAVSVNMALHVGDRLEFITWTDARFRWRNLGRSADSRGRFRRVLLYSQSIRIHKSTDRLPDSRPDSLGTSN